MTSSSNVGMCVPERSGESCHLRSEVNMRQSHEGGEHFNSQEQNLIRQNDSKEPISGHIREIKGPKQLNRGEKSAGPAERVRSRREVKRLAKLQIVSGVWPRASKFDISFDCVKRVQISE